MDDSISAQRAPAPAIGRLERSPAADERELDEIVEDLNRICTSKALEGARLVGEYIINHFFGGSLDCLRARGRSDESFRRLGQHPGLQLSRSFLWTSVAVVAQLEAIPADLAERLPLSHHRLLLSVHSPNEKVALATRAVQAGLTRQMLAAEIRRDRELAPEAVPRTGRPPTPELLKCLREVRQAAAKTLEAAGRPASCDRLGDVEALGDLISSIERQMEALRGVMEVLRGRLVPSKQPKR